MLRCGHGWIGATGPWLLELEIDANWNDLDFNIESEGKWAMTFINPT
jgi:hypothetical protein